MVERDDGKSPLNNSPDSKNENTSLVPDPSYAHIAPDVANNALTEIAEPNTSRTLEDILIDLHTKANNPTADITVTRDEHLSVLKEINVAWTNSYDLGRVMGLTEDDLIQIQMEGLKADDTIDALAKSWAAHPKEYREKIIKLVWESFPRRGRRMWGYFGPNAVEHVDGILSKKAKLEKTFRKFGVTQKFLERQFDRELYSEYEDPRNILFLMYENGLSTEELADLGLNSLRLKPMLEKGKPQELRIESKNSQRNLEILERKMQTLDVTFNAWLGGNLPTGYAIKEMHHILLGDDPEYLLKGITPTPAGQYRKSDVSIGEEGKEVPLVKSTDLDPLMGQFTKEWDQYFETQSTIYDEEGNLKTGKLLRDAIHEAAWMAAVIHEEVIRLHPFQDGSGRVGRIAAQRLLRGAGLKGVDFMSIYDAEERERYINIQEVVHTETDIRPLEIYMLIKQKLEYDPNNPEDAAICAALDEIITKMSRHFTLFPPGSYKKPGTYAQGESDLEYVVKDPGKRTMKYIWGSFEDLLDRPQLEEIDEAETLSENELDEKEN